MHIAFLLLLLISLFACTDQTSSSAQSTPKPASVTQKELTDTISWAYFLQHLPEKNAPILDYKGNPISFQQKHAAVIDYDIGKRDLQQCADAIMRLRAEYLFSQNRFHDIHFHFTGGQDYSFADYCKGKRPVPNGAGIRFVDESPVGITHQNLRRYLDIVYTYAGTISLAKELRSADSFSIGTIVITPGSPGHCFIITDEATTTAGNKVYKLAEGYTPAQSIYVLKNLAEPQLRQWHRLSRGLIETASYTFSGYQLKKFE